jgi:hypothetical protein
VAREAEGPDRAMKTVCPRHCRQRHADGQAPGLVAWAGLPINLDLAFSREQRDKVYVQHLLRKQGSQLRRLLEESVQPCACEIATADGTLKPDTAKDYV